MKNGMTLLELVTVLIIIVVVIAVAMPSFNKMQESASDKDAFANLKRIQEAEKFYNMEMNQGTSYYFPSAGTTTNISDINSYLKLDLRSVASPEWTYTIDFHGCGQAARNGDNNRIWHLEMADKGDAIPLPSGACPP